MKKMSLWKKRLASAGLSLALIFGASVANLATLTIDGLDTVQAAPAVTRQSIHDGAILHAFCWNFNTIKENLPAIAEAGYTAVQTSPINECLSIHDGDMLYGETEDEGRWYYHYQPTDWVIGNYQLGTRDEFKAMCEEADKYGIGIIVDIDPNHTTPLYDQVSEKLKNSAGGEDALYHKGAKVENGDQGGMDYSNRISVTYDAMGGLPDVDTENEGFQEYFYNFLEDCIACGADGFRIDTAKHIALPDDGVPSAYEGEEGRNDFYSNMKADLDAEAAKSYDKLFVYGEVLDGDASRLAAYQDMLGGTVASNYGGSIRNAASSGNVAADKIMNYKIKDDTSTGTTYKADSNKLVTWVESHDNYINDKSYNTVDDKAVILGWAIIAARHDGTPLFFSRPMNSSKENPWGDNKIGAAGSDIYKAPEVVAVNKFRTAMEGENEYLRNPGGNSSILMIERGTKGAVIVNASESSFALDSETNLADGTYKDSVAERTELYSVVNGQITGTIPAKSVVVLDTKADGVYSTIFFHNTDNWSTVTATVGGDSYNTTYMGDNWWKALIPAEEFKVVFTDGTNKSATFSINKESGKYMTATKKKLYATKAEAEEALGIVTRTVYFFNTESWNTVYAYAFSNDESGFKEHLGGWPGSALISEGGYWWRSDIKMVGDHDITVIFNNGNGTQTVDIPMNDKDKNYLAVAGMQDGKLTVEKYSSKKEAEEAVGISGNSTTVHYYNAAGWDQVGVYTWGDYDLGSWPGVICEEEGDGWWKYTINAMPSTDLNIIFNNHVQGDDGKRQTKDMKLDSLKNVYYIGSDYKYGSKAEALEALEKGDLELEKNLNPAPSTGDEEGKITDRPVEEEPELEDGYTRIYFYNASNWDEVAMYSWIDNVGDGCYDGWPGQKMQHIGNGWYSISVEESYVERGDVHFIPNNNGHDLQDNDYKPNKTRPSDEELGKVEKPEEPAEEPSEQPTQPASSTPSQPSTGGQSSAPAASAPASAPAAAVAQAPVIAQIAAPQVPLAGEQPVTKSVSNNTASAKAETKVEETSEEETEAVTEEVTEEVTEDEAVEVTEPEATTVAEDAVPKGAEEKQFPVVPVAVVVGIAVVAGLGFVGFRARKIK